jgi:hypothetical protein
MDEAVSRKRLGRVSFPFSVFCFFVGDPRLARGRPAISPGTGQNGPPLIAFRVERRSSGRSGMDEQARGTLVERRASDGCVASQSRSHTITSFRWRSKSRHWHFSTGSMERRGF